MFLNLKVVGTYEKEENGISLYYVCWVNLCYSNFLYLSLSLDVLFTSFTAPLPFRLFSKLYSCNVFENVIPEHHTVILRKFHVR